MTRHLILSAALSAMFLSSAQTFAQNVYVPKTKTLHDEGSEVLARFSYFSSSKRINPEGEAVDFAEGESFSMMDLDFLGSYGLTNNLQVSLGLTLRNNQSTMLYDEDEYALSSSGPKSGLVELKYSFPHQEGLQFSLEAAYEPSFFTNSEYDGGEPDELVLGDDGASASFGASASYITKSNNVLSGRVLYRNPSNDLSSEVYSEVEGALVWEKFALLAGVENNTSLGQDAYTDDWEAKPAISSGSTALFNSVNRSWTAPYVGMNFAIGKMWRLEARALSRISGVSTDLGNAYTITLARRASDAKAFEKKNTAFKQYTVEATVTKVSKAGTSALIDAGLEDGLKKGDKIDLYHFDYLDGNELIAAAYIVKLGASKSIVKVTKRYSKKRVENGTLAKGGLIRE